ncbi:unnamed protein product [Didymodactylos carnosus]|uniref:Uncharacterized protein n=1 Tax=Didymodactylos carnosus TaxID=1234261 RepID=A0A814KMP3_9BILA|nr:unnamed protein product [Didymodactylos carnosus]CAF3822741.1 unnamed protein product [Didymodactylos carnosus]
MAEIVNNGGYFLSRAGRSKYQFYVIGLIIFLLLLNGYPKFIFKEKYHIPWLTDVRQVQPLECYPVNLSTVSQHWPYFDQKTLSLSISNAHKNNENQVNLKKDSLSLTIVIVTAKPEFHRLPLTLVALLIHLDPLHIKEVMFLVPPRDIELLKPLILTSASIWPWPITFISDDILLKHVHTDSYRLQMMFKLVVAQIIVTEFYLILDSDCVAVWPIHVEHLLWKTKNGNLNTPAVRALYQYEERDDRKLWWPASESVLQVKSNTCTSSSPSSPTIGVTPAILSRSIALRALCRLQYLYGHQHYLIRLANWKLINLIWGSMWTEYTIYFLTSECTQTFHTNHFHMAPSMPPLNLYGLSVYYSTDWHSFNRNQLREIVKTGLKWRQKEFEFGSSIIDYSQKRSLFTVLQGRQYINPILFHKLLYPLYIEHLKLRNSTSTIVEQTINLLDNMVKQLIKS